ncbi:MAG: bifunctional DNA primase/polymerase [Phycisphaeraceae bacterium]|nr:bifunctional DNA primase/polymerase [Phycisphaeraceae bacterium]
MAETMSIAEAARAYLAAGLCVLPARRAEKRPAVGRWKQYQQRLPTAAELSAWMVDPRSGPDAICVLCGQASGHAEIIDFDAGGERFAAWWDHLPLDLRAKLVVEITPSGGRHVIYRSEAPVCGNLKLAQRAVGTRVVTLIETRGEGGLFLCAPTQGYEVVQGDLCNLPRLAEPERDVLLQAAWELNEYLPPVVDGPLTPPPPPEGGQPAVVGDRPGDDFNRRGDPRAVLEQHGWVCVRGGQNEYWRRPGKNTGWSATLKDRVFYVFSSNAAPFAPGKAYSPFSVFTLLNCGGDFEQAARLLRELGYGGDGPPQCHPGVDISRLLGTVVGPTPTNSDTAPSESDLPGDPGPIPEQLFHVPGFIAQVMAFTLANAPYPNIGLAFCGAMALQSYLCGRKVCDQGDLRPNLYLLALASSGTGKDFPRKVNARVLFEIGHVAALGDKFASGEGIQDALARTSAMLFQNDEMDGVLRQINLDRENRRESIPNILLTLYTSANDVYPIRVKAGQKEAAHIDQPHLTLFGTATPQYFYESLSQRMLTNGFFARLIVVDIGKRGEGQSPGSARHLPEPVLQAARWWAEYQPGTRRANLLEVHPEPRVVPCTPEAGRAITDLQRQAEAEYDQAHARNDEVARVAWSRTHENVKKLALLHACSANHEDPVIDLPAVEWASAFAMHQTRRQLFLAANYVAENPFHAECLKLVRKLREAPGCELPHSVLLKRMKMKTKDFRDLVETLVQRGDVTATSVATPGRTGVLYRVAGEKDGE